MATSKHKDRRHEAVQRLEDGRRRPERDRTWSTEVSERVLEVIARTGSPKKAAEATGISASTIHDHRRRDPEFGAKYKQAVDVAFNQVLGRAFDRSLDEYNPSDRLIEVLLKFRFVDRAPAFDPHSEESSTQGPLGLDPSVIVRMAPEDRAALAAALDRYVAYESDLRADNALAIN
ncbi:hypothetical protein GHK33_20250 [Sinorhizobium meliloti]|uniref:hypothetical protein n=1 Tax=Rhizobium meliloti TaxID=382 RepID=UPI0012963236|nr:hypothetical protein [Sinorhizobium meliloti]MQW64883.1 hypothetical protein [Sinorhizobium meliloti]